MKNHGLKIPIKQKFTPDLIAGISVQKVPAADKQSDTIAEICGTKISYRPKREHYFEADTNQKEEQYLRCVSLWRAVIMQAITDAKNGSKKKCKKDAKRDAKAWFEEKTGRLEKVCEFAEYNPVKVRNIYRKTISEGPEEVKVFISEEADGQYLLIF